MNSLNTLVKFDLLTISTMANSIKLIFGTAAPWSFLPLEKAGEFLPVLEKHNIKDLDTAHIYVRRIPLGWY